jgi:hypothetical protein
LASQKAYNPNINHTLTGNTNLKKPLSALIGVALAFLTVSCVFFVSNADAANSSADTWGQISKLPPECFMSLTVVDGKIYAISADHTATGIKVFVYDPETNNWFTQPSSDVFYTDNGLDNNVGTILYQNKIYCFGLGYTYKFYKCYDTATNSWKQIASDPQLRYSASASLVNDKIYVIGGATGSESSPFVEFNTVEMYNPATDSWMTLTQMPEAVSKPTSVVFDEKIYVFGAASGNVLIYNPANDQWKTGPFNSNLVYFRGDGAATSGEYAPKKIYLFQTNDTYIFDPTAETWEKGAFIPESLQGFKVVTADDVFYLI